MRTPWSSTRCWRAAQTDAWFDTPAEVESSPKNLGSLLRLFCVRVPIRSSLSLSRTGRVPFESTHTMDQALILPMLDLGRMMLVSGKIAAARVSGDHLDIRLAGFISQCWCHEVQVSTQSTTPDDFAVMSSREHYSLVCGAPVQRQLESIAFVPRLDQVRISLPDRQCKYSERTIRCVPSHYLPWRTSKARSL